jgi:hypothetical protein
MKTFIATLALLCLAAMVNVQPRPQARASAAVARPAAAEPAADKFQPGCPLPFASIQEHHDIDARCDIDGDTNEAAHKAQNAAKNNFCATGTPIPITVASFVTLQQRAAAKLAAAHAPWGTREDLPPNRAILRDVLHMQNGTPVGEGTTVTLVGFVVGARHSNVRKGESVNCTTKGGENNDIHIEVGEHLNDDPCTTVTAEISPHFRPESWDTFDSFEFTNPVRFAGPLFFDASHRPCTPGHRANPARVAVWEVHPVYSIAVCKSPSLAVCRQNVNTPFCMGIGTVNKPNLLHACLLDGLTPEDSLGL